MESEIEEEGGLREGWRRDPPQHNDNRRDLATVPHRPLDTQPRGPQVSSAHYTRSLLLNSLTLHLHTHHFFSLLLFSFFSSLLYFTSFFSTTPHFLFSFSQNSSLSPLCLLHFICADHALCVYVCECVIITI